VNSYHEHKANLTQLNTCGSHGAWICLYAFTVVQVNLQ